MSHPDLPHGNTPLAAQGMAAIASEFSQSLSAFDMLDILQSSLRQDQDGIGMMFTQSQMLDAMFHRMTMKAMRGIDEKGAPIKDYVEHKTLGLALRLQKQCSTTMECISMLRARQKEDDIRENEKNRKRSERCNTW